MNAKELANLLNRLENAGTRLEELKLVVRVHLPGALGGTPATNVTGFLQGFDWDSGKLLITTEAQLTQLSAEEVQAITKSAREGQSWDSLQLHKENKRLQAENTGLKAALVAAHNPDEAADAVEVLRRLSTGEWQLTKHAPDPDMTDTFNTENAWSVQRTCAPFADRNNNRLWAGATALGALSAAEWGLWGKYRTPKDNAEALNAEKAAD